MSSYPRGRSNSLSGWRYDPLNDANVLCRNPTRDRCGAVPCIPSVDRMTASRPHAHPVRRHRRWPWVTLLCAVVIVAALPILPAGHAAAHSTTISSTRDSATSHRGQPAGIGEDPASAEVIRHVLDGNGARALAALPPGFESTMGYRPVIEGGTASNPDGDCSSPIPLPDKFEPFCRTHDFGYDVLRYSARTGHPLGAWARLGLDTMLVTRMHDTCDDPICDAAAELARVGLAVNTWNEGDGPPRDRLTPLTAAASAVRHLIHDDHRADENHGTDENHGNTHGAAQSSSDAQPAVAAR